MCLGGARLGSTGFGGTCFGGTGFHGVSLDDSEFSQRLCHIDDCI